MKVRIYRFTFLLTLVILGHTVIRSQDQTVRNGIKNFQDGDYTAAIQTLKDTNDAVGLRFLGRAYEAVGKKKEAAESFSLSLRNGYSVFETSLANWRTGTTGSPLSVVLRDLEEVTPASFASAGDAFRLGSKTSSSNEWRMKANVLHALKEMERSNAEFYRPDDVNTRFKMINQPAAKVVGTGCFGTQGTVRLQVLLFPDGKSIIVIPYSKWLAGCNEQAMIAAANIKFEPAMKDGKPVGTIAFVDYRFS